MQHAESFEIQISLQRHCIPFVKKDVWTNIQDRDDCRQIVLLFLLSIKYVSINAEKNAYQPYTVITETSITLNLSFKIKS